MEEIKTLLLSFGQSRHAKAMIALAASFFLAKVIEILLTRFLSRVVRRTRTDVDDQIIAMLHKPIFHSVWLAGAAIALRIEQLPEPYNRYAFALVVSVVVLLWAMLGVRLSALIFSRMARYPEHFKAVQPATQPVFEIASKLVLFGAALYFILTAWKIDPTGWVTSAGIIGIAVGFAAKDTLANLFAGVFILADAPYKVGDFIQIEGHRGQVEKIGLRSTRILTRDDIEITIPNSVIANTRIINESGGPSVKHRLRVPVGVAYGTDVDLVRRVLLEVAEKDPYLCPEPPPQVRFRAFGASSLDFELRGWIENPMEVGGAIDSLNTAIYKALARHQIEIPFPKRDVYIKQVAGAEDAGTAKSAEAPVEAKAGRESSVE